MKRILLVSIAFIIGIYLNSTALGFSELAGSCEPECTKCHTLSKEEASTIVKEIAPSVEVIDVRQSPVRGLWEITFKAQGRVGIVYMDFSKANIIQGPILNVKAKTDLTAQRLQELTKVDVSKIPLKEAILMGSPDAKYKVIVFDDPD